MSSSLVIGSANASKGAFTTIGNLDSPLVAGVDARGIVTPWPSGWSLDWWIGADDRWHIPAREVAVRQQLIDASPVVETAMRIPGGDAVQSAYAIRRSSLENGGELVIVDIENRSKVPVALALVVRPESVEGHAAIEHIELHDEAIVTVDGHVALLLPKPPSRSCSSTSEGEDIVEKVQSGEARENWAGPVRSADGLAQAAFVYPLPHGTSLQVALPLERQPYNPQPAPTFPQTVPGATDVARGWRAQTRRGLRLELPDNRLAEGINASLCSLLLLHDSERILGPFGQRSQQYVGAQDTASVAHVLDLYGFHEEVARTIASSADSPWDKEDLAQRQQEAAPNGDSALLWTLVQHWRLTRDTKLVDAMVEAVAASAQRLGSPRVRSWRRRSQRRGSQAGGAHGDPQDDLWRVVALRAAAELLAAADQSKAAQDAARLADSAEQALEAANATSKAARATDPLQMSPIGTRTPGSLALIDPAFHLGQNISDAASQPPHALAELAGAELLAKDRRCLEHLARLLDLASPTWTWTKDVDAKSPGETANVGYHGVVAARLLQLVRLLLIRDTWRAEDEPDAGQIAPTGTVRPPDGLAMATLVPEAWLGQGWEVHDAPTAQGRFSYGVRWHGERPALLWELQPHPSSTEAREEGGSAPAVRLTAPGLDPSWSSIDPAGEALLQEFRSG